MVERRAGGETGVAAVVCSGRGCRLAGRTSRSVVTPLPAEAACATIEDKPDVAFEALFPQPACFLIEYRDGFRGAVLMCAGTDTVLKTFVYAARIEDQVQATEVYLGDNPFPHFSYLSLNVEEMFVAANQPGR